MSWFALCHKISLTSIIHFCSIYPHPMTHSSCGTKHFVTRIAVYKEKLYVLTAQVKEKDFDQYEQEILETVKTFQVLWIFFYFLLKCFFEFIIKTFQQNTTPVQQVRQAIIKCTTRNEMKHFWINVEWVSTITKGISLFSTPKILWLVHTVQNLRHTLWMNDKDISAKYWISVPHSLNWVCSSMLNLWPYTHPRNLMGEYNRQTQFYTNKIYMRKA